MFASRVLKGRRYDDAIASCLKYCDGDPNFCGLASPGQIYNFVHQKVPKKLKGKDVRINGIKVQVKVPTTNRSPLFRNKRFMLNEMTPQNASKFTIFLEDKNSRSFYNFSFCATFSLLN